jgi:precorrin-2 dehydrogenase / sirohydrochlorin ferrochelatase
MPDPNFTYPIFLSLAGRRTLVVGGGEVALRKAQDLADAGADVRAVSPEFLPEFAKDARLECVTGEYHPQHMAGVFLAVAATDDETVNARVAADAAEFGAIANIVDRPSLCDFIVPAVVRRGRLTIAVSTGGAAPSLARRLRERLDKEFGPHYATYLDVMDEVRNEVHARGLPEATRRRVFERLSEDDIVEAARHGVKALRKVIEIAIEEVIGGRK